jgi:WD40 repeat protein
MYRRSTTFAVLMVALLAGMTSGCDKDDGSAPAAQGAGAQPEAPTIEPARFLEGHADGVSSVAFSPDSKRVITGSYDATARVWDAASAKELLRLEGHAGAVYSVAYSDDGTRVATGGGDDVVMVWDAESGELLAMLEGHQRGGVMGVAFVPNGSVVSVGQDASLRRWDADSERQIGAARADTMGVHCVAVSADGTRLATGARSGFIVVWDTDTGRPVWREKAPRNDAEEEQLRARQAEKAGGAGGGEGADGAEAPAADTGRRPAPVSQIAFSADGSKLYSQTFFGPVHEWDAGTGKHLRHYEPYQPAMAMDASGDGRHVLIVATDGLRLFDAASMKVVANLAANPLASGDRAHRAAVSPDGRLAALGLGGGWDDSNQWRKATDTRVPIWDLSSLPK